MTKVLVTGGAGFIGTHVCAELIAAGYKVVALDSFHPAAHRSVGADVATGVELLIADVRDPVAVRDALRGVDVVAHHAAVVGMGVDVADLPEYVGCNDLGTAVLLAEMAYARKIRLVLASSMVVYGEGAYTCAEHGPVRPGERGIADLHSGRFDPPCPHCGVPLLPILVGEDARLEPRSVYAATKLAQEHLSAAWARQCDGTAVALRYHNVYGPGMPRDTPYSGVAAIFRSALAAGRPPRVFEDGHQRRDFIHVRDVAVAVRVAVAATGTEEIGGFTAYNIASGKPTTIGAMAAALATEFDGPMPVVTGEFRAGDVRHVVASPRRAAVELGFTAGIELDVGLAEFATAQLRG